MQLFLECKHSRVPIYEGSIDQIVGILHLRDLVRGLRSARRRTARELSKAPYFVPEAKPLPELLKEFQARRQQMAIVVDEYGGTAGLVTAEDVVEEIVGEIVDEHEVLPPAVEAAGDGRWRLDGRSDIEILDELFEVDLDETAYQTVGGFIFGALGYIPTPGEVVESQGLRFTVEEVQERRIQTVVVERTAPEEEAEGV
jgi:CBS domain containing-hemolysin-like protein